MSTRNPTLNKQFTRKRTAWNIYEDNIIKNWVIANGVGRWAECSKLLVNKSMKQCRDRWSYVLDPNINRDTQWNRVEDYILVKLYLIFGSRWAKISRYLLGRAPIQIKNRFNSIMKSKKQIKKIEKLINKDLDSKRILCYLYTFEIDQLIQNYIEPSNPYNILIEIIRTLEWLGDKHSNEKSRFFELLRREIGASELGMTKINEDMSKLSFSLANELNASKCALSVIHGLLKEVDLTK